MKNNIASDKVISRVVIILMGKEKMGDRDSSWLMPILDK